MPNERPVDSRRPMRLPSVCRDLLLLALGDATGPDVQAADERELVALLERDLAGSLDDWETTDRAAKDAAHARLNSRSTLRKLVAALPPLRSRAWSDVDAHTMLERLSEVAHIEWEAPPSTDPSRRKPQAYSPSTRFAVGDVVRHPTFGDGRVVEVTDSLARVDFDGTRRALAHGR